MLESSSSVGQAMMRFGVLRMVCTYYIESAAEEFVGSFSFEIMRGLNLLLRSDILGFSQCEIMGY